MSDSKLLKIPVSSIRLNAVTLRSVNKELEGYKYLRLSIQRNGLLNPIAVREIQNPDNPDVQLYSLIDGGNRLECHKDLGLEYIDAKVTDMASADVLAAQIMTNANKLDTKPVDYTKALVELLKHDPTMTLEALSILITQPVKWIEERLGLLKLPENIQKFINDSAINVTNAIALSTLPPELIEEFLDRAKTMTTVDFSASVSKRRAEHRKAILAGKKPETVVWTPRAHLHTAAQIKDQLETPGEIAALIQRENITSPIEAAKMALSWVLHIDPINSDLQKKEEEKRKLEDQQKKTALALEKAEKAKKDADALVATTRG